jgi:transposase
MMTKTRRQYSREFKREAVQLLETSGKSASELERELGIGKGNLWRWKREVAADGKDAFPGHGRLAAEQERLRQLERELEIVRQERDIRKKAGAIFSRPSQ